MTNIIDNMLSLCPVSEDTIQEKMYDFMSFP